MEEYKKKYEQALENLKKIKAANKDNKELVDFIEYEYPELKESEDERIRRDIIRYLKKTSPAIGENIEKMLAWLEKQGKKVDVIENFNTEFERQISHLIASTINKEHEYNEGFVKWAANALLNYAKQELEKQGKKSHCNGEVNDETLQKQLQIWFDKGKCSGRDEVIFHPEKFGLQKQVGQKPAWSEEDERYYDSALWHIKNSCGIEGNIYNWLKSLKERYTWKPSDEQMEALLKLEEMHVLEHEKNQENAHLYMVIKSLKEQLKKLKGE